MDLNQIYYLNKARKKLEKVLGEPLNGKYFEYLHQSCLFNPSLTRDEFDEKIRSLVHDNERMDEQLECHHNFVWALLNKITLASYNMHKSKPARQANNKGAFEAADYADHSQSKSTNRSIPPNYSYPRAAVELFAPYSGFIACRIDIATWKCGLEGADSEVTPLIAHACQTFLKNIITAMITKVKGYKIREGKFQYGFNMPLPDPYIRNSNNVVDDSTESNIAFNEDMLLPKCKMSLERTTNERAFAYAASKRRKTDITLDTKLLYETIRENPSLFGQHGFHKVQTLKLSLHDNPDLSLSEDDDSDG